MIFANALGGADKLTELQLVQVRDAAELQAAFECARGHYLAGTQQDETRVVRLCNAAARAKRALKLDLPLRPSTPSLADYLRTRQPAAGAPDASPGGSDATTPLRGADSAAAGQGGPS